MGTKIPTYLIVSVTAWGSRAVNMVCSILLIRLLIPYLGVDGYAAYSVLVGLTAWFALSDLGAAAALQNSVSQRRVEEKRYEDLLTLGLAIACSLGISVGAAVLLLSPFLSDLLLRQFTSLSGSESSGAFVSFALLSLILAQGSIVYRIWYAEHRGYLSNVMPAVAAVIGLIGVSWLTKQDVDQPLLWVVMITTGAPALVAVLCMTARLAVSARELRLPKRSDLRPLAKVSSRFMLMSFIATSVNSIDLIVLSQLVPPEEIISYALLVKLFQIPVMMYGAVLQAFWPHSAEHAHRGEWEQVRRFIYLFVAATTVALVLFSTGLVLGGEYVAGLFAADSAEVVLPVGLTVALGVSFIIRCWCDVHAVVLQSMNRFRVLLSVASVQAVVNGVLQVLLTTYYGATGLVVAVIISYILTAVIALPIAVRNVMRRALDAPPGPPAQG